MKQATISHVDSQIDKVETTTIKAMRLVDHEKGDKSLVRITRVNEYLTSGRVRENELVIRLTVPEAREIALALYPELAIYEQIVRTEMATPRKP